MTHEMARLITTIADAVVDELVAEGALEEDGLAGADVPALREMARSAARRAVTPAMVTQLEELDR